MTNVTDFELNTLGGDAMPLSQYKGNVLLLVNVASKCGLTPQYQGLQALHQEYEGEGFKVIGLPCNQFGEQEPGSPEEIEQFCQTNFGVTFPMSAKIEVNGAGRHPLYHYLAGDEAKFPGDITWNFEKFLIGRDGDVVARFSPKVTPEASELAEAIETALRA
jgi:glutathione peroxidase